MVATLSYGEYISARVSLGTASVYMNAVDLWQRWLNDRQPSQELAQRYINTLTLQRKAPNTIALKAYAIKSWFKWRGQKIDLDHPTIRLSEPEYLDVEQVRELINICRTLLERVLVTVLFDTALRISELLNLELRDVDYAGKMLTVTSKGGQRQSVNISENALAVLGEWIENRGHSGKRVFMDIDYQYARLLLKRLGKRIGVELRPHLLRHSRAIHMLKGGAQPYVVQQHLRHKNIATTLNIYGRFATTDLKEKIVPW